MKLNEFAKGVHQNAVEHGWWEDQRTFGEIVSLCHSELSEALEEFRANRPVVWRKCMTCEGDTPCMETGCGDWHDGVCELSCISPKPEGIAVELADCIIRILDWLGEEEMDPDALLAEAKRYMMCDVPVPLYAASIGDHIARWHLLLSLAYSCWCRASGTYAAALRMALCIYEILNWAEDNGVDMEAILAQKHEYNRTRPYRHGGKAL